MDPWNKDMFISRNNRWNWNRFRVCIQKFERRNIRKLYNWNNKRVILKDENMKRNIMNLTEGEKESIQFFVPKNPKETDAWRSVFQQVEGYFKTERLLEDDIILLLTKNSPYFVSFELLPGFHEVRDPSMVLGSFAGAEVPFKLIIILRAWKQTDICFAIGPSEIALGFWNP